MTTLLIRFDAPVTDTGNSAIVAEVFDDKLWRVWRGTIGLKGSEEVQLSRPGPHVVRAWLPNGEVITDQAIAVEGQQTAVWLRPELRSPREDYGWAYYAQAQADASEGVFFGGPHLFPWAVFPYMTRFARVRVQVISPGARDSMDSRALIQVEGGDQKRSQSLTLRRDAPTRLRVSTDDGQNWLQIDERFAFATRKPRMSWVALPTISQAQVDVLLSYNPMGGIQVNVQMEPDANAMMSYMNQGDHAMARVVLSESLCQRAEKMLREKRANPILATVAGYTLLRAGDFRRMHDWSFNLANWFEDLPDGPVIAAWHILRKSGHLSEAKVFFRMAVERGVPLFSAGLRLLFELGEIMAADEPSLSEDDRRQIARLRRLENARQRWSPVTLLRSNDLTESTVFERQREPSYAR